MRITYDKRVSVYNKGKQINLNTFDKIKKILDRMDQNKYTEVVMGDKDVLLSIGGGNGIYIVFYTFEDKYYSLINNDATNETGEKYLVAGGQGGCFPQRQIVNYDSMMQACEYYYKNNGMDVSLIWEENE